METLKEISLLIGIWVAIYGIDSWRREHTGRRRIELAEETLSLFYEAKDAIAHIRHPASYESETADVKRGENESEKDYNARKNASIVFTRYNSHQDLFNKIHSMRYRFMAQIGKDESQPFNDLRKIVTEIFISARMLARIWAREYFRNDESWEKHLKDMQKYESIFWEGTKEEDPINPKLNKVIEDIENACKKVIEGQGTLFSVLNRPLFKKR
jgi:hypothetical protein